MVKGDKEVRLEDGDFDHLKGKVYLDDTEDNLSRAI